MVTINYYLKGAISEKTIKQLKKEKNAGINARLNKPIQLFLMVSGLGKRIQIYTKRRISQNEWDKEKQQVDTRKNKLNGTEINSWLTIFKEAVIKQNSKNESSGGNSDTIDHLFSATVDHLIENFFNSINKGLQAVKQLFSWWSITNENRWSIVSEFPKRGLFIP